MHILKIIIISSIFYIKAYASYEYCLKNHVSGPVEQITLNQQLAKSLCGFCAIGGDEGVALKILNENSNKVCEELNVNAQDCNGETFLHQAIDRSFRNVLLKLLEMGANPNVNSKFGVNPTERALQIKEFQLAFDLIRGGGGD